jgi:CO/xanthine dehydrogenase Mo-binding subunit
VNDGSRIEHRIRIEPDGMVTVLSGKVEFGQGIRTAFAQIVADELDVPIERVRVVMGDTALVPVDAGTYGSHSVEQEAPQLKRAAAAARELRGRSAAIAGDVPQRTTHVPPTTHEPYVGRPMPRLEAPDVVSGRATYAADVRLPRMLRGAIARPPARGARVRGLNDAAARAMPGVVAVVREGDVVGVVAERDEQARAAADALDVDWEIARPPDAQTVTIPMRDDGAVDEALATGKRLEATYTLPPIASAPIGPSAAVADVRSDGATVYVNSHRPFGTRGALAGRLGLDEDRVRVITTMGSGTYGRSSQADAAYEAAILSKHAGRPVLVQWTRAEEFALSPSRPEAVLEVAATLASDGKIAAWRYDEHTNVHTAGVGTDPRIAPHTSGRNAIPPYAIPRARVTLHVEPTPLRTANFRSLAAAENVFAIESFMDELARAASADPLQFRLRHIEDANLRRVLERVAERAGWGKAQGPGRGLGLACTTYHGTRIAEAALVEVPATGRARLVAVWAVVDPGHVVNPDGVRNQVEGGIQQSASWTLIEELRHRDGRVAQQAWDAYPIATFRDAPEEIDVLVAGDPLSPSTGVGEPGAVPTAAAIANAVFAACGARVRELPITRTRVREAMARRP